MSKNLNNFLDKLDVEKFFKEYTAKYTEWELVRLYRFQKTASNVRIYPGQKVWRRTFKLTESRYGFKKTPHVEYFTQAEYMMMKLKGEV